MGSEYGLPIFLFSYMNERTDLNCVDSSEEVHSLFLKILYINGFVKYVSTDENIVSGVTQTGAEWKETDELVRSLYDTMKPQFYESLHKTT